MTREEMLEPCPHCGNDGSGPIEHALQICHSENYPRADSWSVQCDKCSATMGYSDSEEEAIEAWNRRAFPQRQDISTAPYDTPVDVKVGGMTFGAILRRGASVNSDGEDCDQWQATVEGEHPPCWTDGACWESNSYGAPSLQPEAFQTLASPQEVAPAEDVVRAAEQRGYAEGLLEASRIVKSMTATEGVLHKPTQSLICTVLKTSATKSGVLASAATVPGAPNGEGG